MATEEKVKKRFVRKFLEFLVTALAAIVVVLTIFLFIEITKLSGDSMETTYSDGQYVLVKKAFNDYEKGDVVVFKYNSINEYHYKNTYFQNGYATTDNTGMIGELYIKRIVGMPGDRVKILSGELSINDEVINKTTTDIPYQYYELGTNQYFVVGDNTDDSFDSRQHGPVNISELRGKVIPQMEKAN